jgi:GMP synthase-like glutamine amidotransferase
VHLAIFTCPRRNQAIGICFGHQIIARALGGECIPNEGKWEVGVTPIELSPLGERLLGAHNLVSAPFYVSYSMP